MPFFNFVPSMPICGGEGQRVAIGRWTDDLSVGDARIDAQHRSIFDFAGVLEMDLANDSGGDPKRALAFLRRYVIQHFAAEETLLKRADYEKILQHQDLHRGLTAQVVEAEARFQDQDPRAAQSVVEVLVAIIEHIRNADAQFSGFICSLSSRKSSDSHPLSRSLLAVEEDHHRLFQYIHDFGAAVKAGRARPVLENLLPELEDFCRDHFRREELLMELTGYTGADRHCTAHQELRDGLRELRERHQNGIDATKAMLDLLDRWSLEHLTGEDFLLASYLWSSP